jgi:predicted aminopeptidase
MGALFLREAAVLLRHARNIAMALACRDGKDLQGMLSYDRWLSLELSAVEIAAFGLFCLIVAAAGESWFFLGGGLACFFLGFTHWQRSRKAHRAKVESVPANPAQ